MLIGSPWGFTRTAPEVATAISEIDRPAHHRVLHRRCKAFVLECFRWHDSCMYHLLLCPDGRRAARHYRAAGSPGAIRGPVGAQQRFLLHNRHSSIQVIREQPALASFVAVVSDRRATRVLCSSHSGRAFPFQANSDLERLNWAEVVRAANASPERAPMYVRPLLANVVRETLYPDISALRCDSFARTFTLSRLEERIAALRDSANQINDSQIMAGAMRYRTHPTRGNWVTKYVVLTPDAFYLFESEVRPFSRYCFVTAMESKHFSHIIVSLLIRAENSTVLCRSTARGLNKPIFLERPTRSSCGAPSSTSRWKRPLLRAESSGCRQPRAQYSSSTPPRRRSERRDRS